MKNMKMLVSLVLLSLGTWVGCGGVEVAEPAQEGAMQSVEQPLCGSSPPETGCIPGTMQARACTYYNQAFSHTCQGMQNGHLVCYMYKCTNTWVTNTALGSCSDVCK
jgi:hypothetical protein